MRVAGLGLLVAGSLGAQKSDTVVRVATAPVHAGVAELRRDIAIGVADGDEKYMIGAINDIAVGANGTMYVLDRSVPVVRVYDAAGKFLKNIGRSGSGPGEFRYATAIAIAKNGNLLLYDQGNARINVYAPAGDVVTSWPTRGGSGTGSGKGILTSDSLGTTYIRAPMWRPRVASRLMWAWVRFAADGSLRDTTPGPEGQAPILSAERGGSSKTMGVPFAPSDFTVLSPLGYFVSSRSPVIAIELHEPGKPIVSIRRDVPLAAVTSHERDSARTAATESMQQLDPSWSWNGPDIPKTKAAILGLRVSADGLLWVQLSRGPRLEDPSANGGRGGSPTASMGAGRSTGPARNPTWSCPLDSWTIHDVYEPSGRYLGQVKLPEKTDVIMMRGDFVWAATCNEDDAPQVVRYRIAWK
jgi:hypothetical protein